MHQASALHCRSSSLLPWFALSLDLLYSLWLYDFANVSRHHLTLSCASISLPDCSLLLWFDETVNSSVIQNSLFGVVLAFLVGLGPHVTIQLAVSLASWAGRAGEVCILLYE